MKKIKIHQQTQFGEFVHTGPAENPEAVRSLSLTHVPSVEMAKDLVSWARIAPIGSKVDINKFTWAEIIEEEK